MEKPSEIKKPSAYCLVHSHWRDDYKKIKDLINGLEPILEKLSVEEAIYVEKIVQKAYHSGISHWRDDHKEIKDLINGLEPILEKLSVEEAIHVKKIVQKAYHSGISDEADNNAGEDL